MQHPQSNLAPPFNITRASHLVFTARDLKASRAFYTEVVGLVVSDENDDTIWMHGVEERCHHSLTLKKAKAEPVCERVGFRVFTDDDLLKAKAHFDRAGVEARFVDVPFQGRTLHVADHTGTPLELVATQQTHVRTQTKTHTHKGAGALRMDHYQVLVPDVAAAAKFYLDLGFRVSDYTVFGEDRIVAIFMYRKDNPHDMVFLQRSGPRFASDFLTSGFIRGERIHRSGQRLMILRRNEDCGVPPDFTQTRNISEYQRTIGQRCF